MSCDRHPDAHGAHCFCGRRARWHVEVSYQRCGNFCGIHARAIQRRSLWSAVFNHPILLEKNMPETSRARLRGAIIAALPATGEPMAERDLRDDICERQSYDPEAARAVLAELEGQGAIRWVAQRGWAVGGRPSLDDQEMAALNASEGVRSTRGHGVNE